MLRDMLPPGILSWCEVVCGSFQVCWPSGPEAGTIGEPGVIGAWLEPDSAQARQAILRPLALCSICGNGSRRTTQDSKTGPPPMGTGRRSVPRLVDSERSSAFARGHFPLVGG